MPLKMARERKLKAVAPLVTHSDELPLDKKLLLSMHETMVKARVLEERLIAMYKSGHGYFWIGGPGEEAFNVPLGLHIKKGQGPAFDFLHFHYRQSATMLAMGEDPIHALRQMKNTKTDPYSGGRNFAGHFSKREWNVVPVSSPIEVQYAMAPGTALAQKRHGGDGITIVCGGDAGTAEGDFASCLIWSSRPGQELPVLMIITNNQWGISTPAATQHAEEHIIDRGRPFGIPGEVVDGNDPIASWHAVRRALEYCRRERRPYLLEAMVSRLYGHSSSSGALRVKNEVDCVPLFERKLLEAGAVDEAALGRIHDEARAEADEALEMALQEDKPRPDDVYRHTYADSPVDVVYPGDYTGLPN